MFTRPAKDQDQLDIYIPKEMATPRPLTMAPGWIYQMRSDDGNGWDG